VSTISTYPVVHNIRLQIQHAIWIQVVRKNSAAFPGSGHGEWSYASEDICYEIGWGELVDEALVLGVKAGVPVDLGKIKGIAAVGFVLGCMREGVVERTATYVFDDVVWFPCDQFHFEKPELCVYTVDFIDNRLDLCVFLLANMRLAEFIQEMTTHVENDLTN
jgi:hypothetical protein